MFYVLYPGWCVNSKQAIRRPGFDHNTDRNPMHVRRNGARCLNQLRPGFRTGPGMVQVEARQADAAVRPIPAKFSSGMVYQTPISRGICHSRILPGRSSDALGEFAPVGDNWWRVDCLFFPMGLAVGYYQRAELGARDINLTHTCTMSFMQRICGCPFMFCESGASDRAGRSSLPSAQPARSEIEGAGVTNRFCDSLGKSLLASPHDLPWACRIGFKRDRRKIYG